MNKEFRAYDKITKKMHYFALKDLTWWDDWKVFISWREPYIIWEWEYNPNLIIDEVS